VNQRPETSLEQLHSNCDDCRQIAEQYQPGLNPDAAKAFIENIEQHLKWQHPKNSVLMRQCE
jgi:hypothetical protein